MEKVVYILGAGFSAYAGLPIMSNFLVKSKDMYYANVNKYRYFKNIFRRIDQLSKIKNYFKSDLFNIEEILSILETESILYRKTDRSEFINYLVDVITFYSFSDSTITKPSPGNWYDFLFSNNNMVRSYGYFIGSLFNLKFDLIEGNERQFKVVGIDSKTKYAIVTLNYDLIPENIIKGLKNNYNLSEDISFEKLKYDPSWNRPYLAKLHGSIDSKDIIPPTWSKTRTREIERTWKIAYNILKDTNQIRIIGYSLPIADNYITYLLKTAILKNDYLRQIDVICLDPTNEVRERYQRFIDFDYFRFKNAKVEDYLSAVFDKSRRIPGGNIKSVTLDKLETVHIDFMAK